MLEGRMKTCTTIAAVRSELASRGGETVGLVPTMGALHAGHLALFAAARAENATVVASLFVNPAQFNSASDLAAYPRDTQADAKLAADAGVDILFAPDAAELYPDGFATWIEPSGAAEGLEGAFRPGHFRGVATVCVKLFSIVQPTNAYFGRKDAQQVAVIKQTVRDLNIPLTVRVVETVRDSDGLALSSRNARLSPSERTTALAIPQALATHDPVQAQTVLAAAGIHAEYVTVADLDGPTLAIAATVGTTRLIDNVLLEETSR